MRKRKKKKGAKEEECDEESAGRPACFALVMDALFYALSILSFFQKKIKIDSDVHYCLKAWCKIVGCCRARTSLLSKY